MFRVEGLGCRVDNNGLGSGLKMEAKRETI